MTTHTDLVVTTHDLTKTYGDRHAVERLNLTVRRGEVYGFLGPNGAGKTTTLRMLLGLVRPTSGTATVLGSHPGRPEVSARVGALVEGPGFYPSLSGLDNLRVMARYRGLGVRDVHAALERVDLTERGKDAFKSYSLGMKQRLGVASALMGDPELVVLDEPTNGLDPAGMQEMRGLVASLAEAGQTVVLSSHLLAEVQDLCDRVGVINRGRLLRESTVAELRGAARLRVRAEPLDRTLAIAMRLAADSGLDAAAAEDAVQLEGEYVVLPGEVPAPVLARELVADDVALHELATVERTLEEVFFEMTGNPDNSTLEPMEVAS